MAIRFRASFLLKRTGVSTQALVEAARSFLDVLSPEQRAAAQFPIRVHGYLLGAVASAIPQVRKRRHRPEPRELEHLHLGPRNAMLANGALSAMDALLRFPEAVKRESAIDVWLNERDPELGAIAQKWFAQMRDCGDDVRELMHDGAPTACVGDAAFGYVNVFRSHVNVGFFLGAELDDPTGLLEGTGKRMRHVKVRPGSDLDHLALGALIDAAYVVIKSRMAPSPD
jgi:hypothetical protein